MQKELNLDQAIAEISRRLKRHIGSNGTAHLPVSKDFAGFMTPELLSEVSTMWPQHNQLFVQRIRPEPNTDVLSLSPGFYEGDKFINHPLQPTVPTTWFSNVTVTAGNNGRKQILVQDNITGYMWVRTIHSGGEIASGTNAWLRFETQETLWQGSASGGSLTLNSPLIDSTGVDRYSRVFVEYTTTTGQHNRSYGNRYDVTINDSNLDNDGVASATIFEAKVEFTSSTTAVIRRNLAINFYNPNTTDNLASMKSVTDVNVQITRIVGVK